MSVQLGSNKNSYKLVYPASVKVCNQDEYMLEVYKDSQKISKKYKKLEKQVRKIKKFLNSRLQSRQSYSNNKNCSNTSQNHKKLLFCQHNKKSACVISKQKNRSKYLFEKQEGQSEKSFGKTQKLKFKKIGNHNIGNEYVQKNSNCKEQLLQKNLKCRVLSASNLRVSLHPGFMSSQDEARHPYDFKLTKKQQKYIQSKMHANINQNNHNNIKIIRSISLNPSHHKKYAKSERKVGYFNGKQHAVSNQNLNGQPDRKNSVSSCSFGIGENMSSLQNIAIFPSQCSLQQYLMPINESKQLHKHQNCSVQKNNASKNCADKKQQYNAYNKYGQTVDSKSSKYLDDMNIEDRSESSGYTLGPTVNRSSKTSGLQQKDNTYMPDYFLRKPMNKY